MPTALLVLGATGSGFLPYTAGAQLITDIDVQVHSVGGDAHVFVSTPVYRLQHVGWFGIGYATGGLPLLGNPQVGVVWWQFVEFVRQDAVVQVLDPFPTDTFFWQLSPGCVVDFTVSY